MFKDKKAFIKNTICYFIPFVVMTIIALIFLYRTFSLLYEQNTIIMQTQLQSVLTDIEEDISVSKQLADEMCIDSTLSRKNILAYGNPTLAGMERMQLYSQRLQLSPSMFLTYTDSQILTKEGTMKGKVFAERLHLSEDSLAKYRELMQDKENHIQSCVLEKTNGGKYLVLLYYYPQSKNIDEKRIGFIFDAGYIEDVLTEKIKHLDSTLMLLWENEVLVQLKYESQKKVEAEKGLESILIEKQRAGYMLITCKSEYFNVQMHVLLDNRILNGRLTEEAIKMIVLGSICFVTLSIFLWLYGKYRYRLLYELRQLAEGSHQKNFEKNDFDVIRMVLQNNFDKINKQNEELELFRKEAKRQLSWLILNSESPEDVSITELMDSYGIINNGLYYGVLDFFIENKRLEEEIELEDIQEILVHCVVGLKERNVYVVGIALPTRDSNHELRLMLVRTIKQRLKNKGYLCNCASCGLIYDQLTQMYCSQEEAFSILQKVAYSDKKTEIAFFDEFAHVTKNAPHIISELIEEFRVYIQQYDITGMFEVLQKLNRVPRDMDEDLFIYIRYKIIRILVGLINEQQLSVEQVNKLMAFIELEDMEFEAAVKEFIHHNLVKNEKRRLEAEQILVYIQEQFDNPELSLMKVAEYFQTSERSINRILKNSIAKTYKEYLDYLRLQKACALLVSTENDIKDIIKLVGYFDVSSFIRLFKQNYGVTPSEYRQEGMVKNTERSGR